MIRSRVQKTYKTTGILIKLRTKSQKGYQNIERALRREGLRIAFSQRCRTLYNQWKPCFLQRQKKRRKNVIKQMVFASFSAKILKKRSKNIVKALPGGGCDNVFSRQQNIIKPMGNLLFATPQKAKSL